MNRFILTGIILWMCVSVSGQVAIPDTIYVYETIIVYDTIVIRDTIRINKTSVMPDRQTSSDSSAFFSPPAATFSENGIILHENNQQTKSKTMKTMKLNMTNYLTPIILTAQSMAGLSAQETTPANDMKQFPMQMSIVYPMTTQGYQTVDYCYNVSFNLLTGKVGAVTGVEFGGIFNRVEQDMKGVQFGGLFNLTKKVNGVQFGGLGNAADDVQGIQFGGLGNIANDVSGIQFGGLANIAESATGVQFACLANINKKMKGLQFGGITNLCERNEGMQFAGISNVTEESKGFQFAGIANISKEVSGTSFAGVFNRTGTLRGFQFGIVNVTDTVESGVSMAIVNIVKKGFYDEWALTTADYLNVGLSYKMGMRKFYTILTAGVCFIEDNLWVTGIGFGNRTPLSRRIDFQPEIVSYNYFPNDFKNVRATWSTHLKFGFVYNMNDKLGIVVAPSIYHLSANINGGKAYRVSPIKEFFSIKSNSGNDLNTIGVGISVGLVLR